MKLGRFQNFVSLRDSDTRVKIQFKGTDSVLDFFIIGPKALKFGTEM